MTPKEIEAFPGIDKDGDGKLNVTEHQELVSQVFDRFDQHPRDGFLTAEEIDRGEHEIQKEKSWWSKYWWVGGLAVVVLLVSVAGLSFFMVRKRRAKRGQAGNGMAWSEA